MADFCRQCTRYYFGENLEEVNDMLGLTTEEDLANGLYAVVLCEGCGPCQVLPDGSCIGQCYAKSHRCSSSLLPTLYKSEQLLQLNSIRFLYDQFREAIT